MSAGVSSVGFPAAPLAVWLAAFFLSFLSCRFVRRFACRLVSCRFSFRSSGRVSGRCVVGLSMRAGGRGERKSEAEGMPTASTLSVFYPPALVGYFEAWELRLVVFVRRVFFFAVVGRCTAICGVVLLWLV